MKVDIKRLKQSHWSKLEAHNAEIVADFVDSLMNRHDFDYIQGLFNENSVYLQHNRGIADGIGELLDYIRHICKQFPEYGYDVKQIIADGDRIIFHSHVTLKAKHRKNDNKGLVIMDVWRLEEGKIIEHWDAIQPLNFMLRLLFLFRGGRVRNNNGLA